MQDDASDDFNDAAEAAEEDEATSQGKRITLSPLTFEEAVRGLLQVMLEPGDLRPEKKPRPPRRDEAKLAEDAGLDPVFLEPDSDSLRYVAQRPLGLLRFHLLRHVIHAFLRASKDGFMLNFEADLSHLVVTFFVESVESDAPVGYSPLTPLPDA
jgi:hypothetical protein